MKLAILPSQIAEKIAAGEVIEKPASVVKELVENSIDAGANQISVRLQDGGKALIELTDNGSGMTPEELQLCILRHATSKIASLSDLESISSLGFRGEALPSVRAVADLTILSRKDSDSAYRWRNGEVERVTFGHFLGSPHGTRITVEGLFAEVPARLKFLRSSRAELAAIREFIEKLSLSRPDIGFNLVHDDRTLLDLPRSSAEDRIRQILGGGQDYPILSEKIDLPAGQDSSGRDLPPLKIQVYWVQGLSSPQTRKVVQVVNGRFLKDRFLQQSMLIAFRQALLPGQFPAALAKIDIDPSFVDVNVHPTKLEVRFLNSRFIQRNLTKLFEKLISQSGAISYVASTPNEFRFSGSLETSPSSFRSSLSVHQPEQISIPTTPSPGAHPFSNARYIGILFNTYFVYDLGREAGLVDQHAAHERIRYEKIRASAMGMEELQEQQLLLPEVVKFEIEEKKQIQERLGILKQIGFEVELFGEQSLVFRSIPVVWGTDQLTVRLTNLVERLKGIDHLDLVDEQIFEKLASEACHSAVRAGDALTRFEAEEILEQLFRCEHPWNCPHGRPTIVKLPETKFEEWFQRKV